MIETLRYKNKFYPAFQSEGNAAQFAIPFARKVCRGKGYDIGCKKADWKLPGAIPIDPVIDSRTDAYKLPDELVDFIFSSHCLEHLEDWVKALDYWHTKLVPGGVLFLYLPHFDQEYWRPWNNKKHKHAFTPEIIEAYMKDKYAKVYCSGKDLNDSFMVIGEKYI